MLQLEEVFIDNYLEKRIERETILNTYLESYNSISSRIERQRFTSVLGNRMIQCKELVAHHDSVIKGYLFNLKKKIVSYFGVEPKGWEEVHYSLDPINEAVFDENLEGQTDLFFAYLHLFITELKVGVVRDTLKKLKVQYKKLENIARTDANSKEPAFDDLQLIISQSQYCSNAFRRKTLLQNLLGSSPKFCVKTESVKLPF